MSSHNNNTSKTVRHCPQCFKASECKNCNGVCMFSKDFIQKRYESNSHVRSSFTSKYYPSEFAILKDKITIISEKELELIDYLAEYQKLENKVKLEILALHTGNCKCHVNKKSDVRKVNANHNHVNGVYHHDNHDHYYDNDKPSCKTNDKMDSVKFQNMLDDEEGKDVEYFEEGEEFPEVDEELMQYIAEY